MVTETATPLSLSTSLSEMELGLPSTTSSPISSRLPLSCSTIHDSLEFRLAAALPCSTIHDSLEFRLAAADAAAAVATTTNTTTSTPPNVTTDCTTGESFELLSPGFGQEATLCGTLTESVHTASWGNTDSTAFSSSPTTALLLEEEVAVAEDPKHRFSSGNVSSSSSPASYDSVTRHKSNHYRKVRAGIKLFSLYRTRYVR
ncbi:hypothetical protein D0Z00_002797 [Geotrichum galactomycetum]|uniref:Uncharacterized protein n=1 Tax=Geotrichum galactomycetum TaxID=27317 RepID=A0ACB6V343_9ASCO|nr:hypothetical protein D0Z00_002797 [Geotrichum candidum]